MNPWFTIFAVPPTCEQEDEGEYGREEQEEEGEADRWYQRHVAGSALGQVFDEEEAEEEKDAEEKKKVHSDGNQGGNLQ